MPAGGGVIQVAAVGRQNANLNGNPDHTLFKTQHRRYTSFAEDFELNDFSSGTVGFGQKVTASISRYGDLVSDIMLEVKIPAISPPTGVLVSSGNVTTDTAVYWVNSIGFAMIESVQLEIGGTYMDTLYPEWMNFWTEMTDRPGARLGEQIGKFVFSPDVEDDMIEFASQPRTLYIPLPFWFNKYFMEHGLSIPLIALSYHEIRVSVTFRPLAECCCVVYKDTSPTHGEYYALADGKLPLNSATASPLSTSDLDARLFVSYVYLEKEEREAFSSVEHEYLVTASQRQQHNVRSTSATSDQVKIFFNHPTNCLTWMVRPTDWMTNRRRYSVGHKDMFDFSLKKQSDVSMWGDVTDAVKSASLSLNGHPRWPNNLPGLFFRQVQPVMKWPNVPDGYMYTFSFSSKGGSWQPTSTLNLSCIDHVQLELKYGSDMPVSDVLIFGESYNVLLVKDGMGGLRQFN